MAGWRTSPTWMTVQCLDYESYATVLHKGLVNGMSEQWTRNSPLLHFYMHPRSTGPLYHLHPPLSSSLPPLHTITVCGAEKYWIATHVSGCRSDLIFVARLPPSTPIFLRLSGRGLWQSRFQNGAGGQRKQGNVISTYGQTRTKSFLLKKKQKSSD